MQFQTRPKRQVFISATPLEILPYLEKKRLRKFVLSIMRFMQKKKRSYSDFLQVEGYEIYS